MLVAKAPVAAILAALMLLPWMSGAQSVVNTCTQAELEAKILAATTNGGTGIVTFNCDGIIVITNTITLRPLLSSANPLVLDATGRSVTLSGSTSTNTAPNRLFLVESNAQVEFINLKIANARYPVGSALWISGQATFAASSCFFSNNIAFGGNGTNGTSASTNTVTGNARDGSSGTAGGIAAGGVIFSLGKVVLNQCTFVTNGVVGGDGGNGGNGGNGTVRGGTGGSGGRGGSAFGGVIYNAGSLFTTNCAFYRNFALGGFGGNGGNTGSGILSGFLGRGAAGGGASGGAVHTVRNAVATNVNSTFAFNVTDGGDSADGGSNQGNGKTGPGGAHASGGAVANYGIQHLFNCTFFSNGANAGNGGRGFDGTVKGGTGGSGGSAWGGNAFTGRKSLLIATHCTFSDGGAVPGTNGAAGSGTLDGKAGSRGASRGANVATSNGTFRLRNTIVANAVTGTNGYGKTFQMQGRNISSDLSFKTYKSGITNVNPLLDTLARNGGPVETIRLLDNSPAINFATNTFDLAVDARGMNRTLGVAPDLGSYEHGIFLTAPTILVQPISVTALRSNNATFSVVAQGDPPLLYRWRRNGADLVNATRDTLTLTNVTDSNEGSYDVVVSNNSGSVESSDASLTVLTPAFITRQPTNLFLSPGATATFSVVAEGEATLRYQWRSNGVPIPGATLTTFNITNVQPNFAANYSVVVANDYRIAISSEAVLTVTSTPPAIVSQPVSTVVLAGRTATFSATASGTLPLDFSLMLNRTNQVFDAPPSYSGGVTFSIPNAQPGNSGSYQIVVANYGGRATSSVVTLQVNVAAPFITQEPTDQTVAAGDNALFTAGVLASSPVLYQWFSNGVAVANATNTFLSLTNLSTNSVGSFSLFASNSAGFTNSRAAALVIAKLPPTIVIQPADTFAKLSDDVTFSVVATGSRPFTYQWLLDGNVLTNQTNSTMILTNIDAEDLGSYSVQVTNEQGTEASDAASLGRLQSFSLNCDGPNCTATVSNPEEGPYYTLQIRDENADAWLGIQTAQFESPNQLRLVATPVPFTEDSADYRVVVTDEEPDLEPSIVTQPEAVNAVVGQNVTFTVEASATVGTLSYRWFLQGTNLLAGQTEPTLKLTNTLPEQAGDYNAVVYGILGATTSAVATLTLQLEPVTIVTPPQNTTVYGTQNATFTVLANGSEPISYQWFFNGSTAIPGATSATLTLTNVQVGDAGSYHVVASNYFRTVASTAATLTVLEPSPVITGQPASVGVYSGGNATFAVTNTGLAPFSYQWYFNSTNILSGATSRVLSLTEVQSSNAGTYQVVITNAVGGVTSSLTTLTVTNSAPIITSQPADLQVPAGTEIALTVGVVGSSPMTFQWYHTPLTTGITVALTNTTNPVLILPIPEGGDEARWEGLFSVSITNTFGGTISADGTINVDGFGNPP